MITGRTSEEIEKDLARLLVRSGLVEGVALPPERDLAVRLGTSRATLRRALAALARAGVVAARRGSGVRLAPRRGWSLSALPALVGAMPPGSAEVALLAPLLVDALALRRGLARRLPAELAGRLAAGSLARARERTTAAWSARARPAEFLAHDAAALRAAPEASGDLASVWLWNDLSRVPEALALHLREPLPLPVDYVARQDALWDALEAGESARAERMISSHLARLDRALLAALAPRPGGAAA